MTFDNINTTLTKDDFKDVKYSVLGIEGQEYRVNRYFTNLESINQAQLLMKITLIEVLSISILFLIPLSYLVYIQSQNVFMNTTTNLRFAKRSHKIDLYNDNEATK